MAKAIYKINIQNWDEHNGGKKKNHRYFMVENRFFEDAKISQLRQIDVLIFLKCLAIAGDLTSSSFEIHAGLMPKRWRVDDKLLDNSLKTLEQYQLLTSEKKESLIIQNNTKQDKAKENKLPAPQKIPTDTELNRKIWAAYFESYVKRYKVEPVRNGTINSQISQLGKRLGADAVDVVKFYLAHNDNFYLKQIHPVGLCLKDAEGLRTQMLRGRAVTSADVREFEKQNHFQSQIERIRNGEV